MVLALILFGVEVKSPAITQESFALAGSGRFSYIVNKLIELHVDEEISPRVLTVCLRSHFVLNLLGT